MGIGIANIRKTLYYLRRNGIKNTCYAALERLQEQRRDSYRYQEPDREELDRQRKDAVRLGEEFSRYDAAPPVFTVLVPAYRTKPRFLRELVECMDRQTYPCWELVIADATEDASVEEELRIICGQRGIEVISGAGTRRTGAQDAPPLPHYVRYQHLSENQGISGNTNAGLALAEGDFVGLLDHDDLLAPDALYEVASRILESRKTGVEPKLLYSDEDKCDAQGTTYYDCNCKEDFNLDLLLSNNYICHFLVVERELLRRTTFRGEYDGAQDYDVTLRAVDWVLQNDPAGERAICHIPRVLYHWRCHTGSTAENPRSKQYAYEAGRRAVQDFLDRRGWKAEAVHLRHLGFYGVRYRDAVYGRMQTVFDTRKDVGIIGGRILAGGRLAGGRRLETGELLYEGISEHYSGYLHRAVLCQDAEAVDLALMSVRPECIALAEEILGVPYRTLPGSDTFDCAVLPEGADQKALAAALGRAVRERGYRILWMPEWSLRVKKREYER